MALIGTTATTATDPYTWKPYTGAFVAVTPIPASTAQPTALPAPARSGTTPAPRPQMPHSGPALAQLLAADLSGNATWYCNADPKRAVLSRCMTIHPDRYKVDDLYAAAGPELRAWLGPTWRGAKVAVCGAGACVSVTLADWCLCTGGPNRVIDLYYDAFAIVGGKVTIRR